jgi:hypothetical protein
MGKDATHAALDRATLLDPGYSAAWHMTRTVTLATAIATLAIWLSRRAAAIDWLLLPAFFIVANAIEWGFHKNPMHRPLPPRILYKNHTLVHHRAFHHDSMPIVATAELGLIMMPWYTMLGLFVLASPIALLGAWWRGSGAAGIFYLSAVLYFVAYESMHAIFHLPERTLARMHLAGGRLFEYLRGHHRHHHRLDRMSHVNFNVTFPLMDWLCRTNEAETHEEVAPAARGASLAPPS